MEKVVEVDRVIEVEKHTNHFVPEIRDVKTEV